MDRRPYLVLLAAVLVAAGLAGPAAAAPPWSAPQDLSFARDSVDDPRVVTGGDGSALAWWWWQAGTRADARTGTSLASRAPGAARFGPRRAAPRGLADLTTYARSRAVVALHWPGRVVTAFGRTDGRFGLATTALSEPGLRGARLAASAAGHVALAFWQDRGTAGDRVLVALRDPGGRFGRPVALTRGRVRSVAVAVGPGGDVLVAWDAAGRVRTRFKRAAARRFATTETIGSEPAYSARLRAAVTAGGRAYVAWSAQRRTEGGERGPVFVQAAVRPSGGRFRAAQLLERQDAERPQGPVGLATGPGRDATVAWTGADGSTARVRAAVTGAGGRFGPAGDVSPPGEQAVLSDLVAATTGARIAVWDDGGFDAGAVRAALAPAGGPFGAAETVSSGLAADEARLGRAAFAPGGGATVVWSSRPEGSRPPGAVRTVAQAAVRP